MTSMALLTDSFDLIRVINLPDRTDRYNEATRQLKALGLEWKQEVSRSSRRPGPQRSPVFHRWVRTDAF